ncbi:MAG: endonuclease III [Bacilli bacterium]
MALPRIATTDVLRTLEDLYPDARCALVHKNAFELLVATILSAQCTDKKVNEVTPRLFARYATAVQMAAAATQDVEQLICECGLFKTKAKNVVATSRIIVERHAGEVPRTMEELTALPGVGRKTANVVLSNAYGVPAIAVDTHVHRVANRLGLAASDDVLETERQLMRRIPRELWSQAHHWLIYHGRQVCIARSPRCEMCALAVHCRHFRAQAKASRKKMAGSGT